MVQCLCVTVLLTALPPFRIGDYWWVSSEVGKETGRLKAKVGESDHLLPPVQGWEFYDGVKWESDPTMVCSRQVNPHCTEVIVELDNGAKEKRPDLAGSYLPVDGEYRRGRPVGSFQESFQQFCCC